MKLFEAIQQTILQQKHMLADVITGEQGRRFSELRAHEEELYPMRIELIELYANSFLLNEDERVELIKAWGQRIGRQTAMIGNTTIDMMLREVPHYRNTIGKLVFEEAKENGYSLEQLYEAIDKFDRAVNDVVYFFSVSFVEYEKEKIEETKLLITELSVPIVAINDTTAILPLVGTIDSERSLVMQERALQEVSRLGMENLVIDLSGVQTIDTFVAQQIFRLLDSLELLGVKGTISGVSPIIAQTLVQLGLDFGKVGSYSSLKQALKVIRH